MEAERCHNYVFQMDVYTLYTTFVLLLELEEFYNEYPDRFRLWYTLDNPPPRWKYSTGYITAEMIRDHLPPPADDVIVFCCGPKPMVKYACMENLDKLGYKPTDVATF